MFEADGQFKLYENLSGQLSDVLTTNEPVCEHGALPTL